MKARKTWSVTTARREFAGLLKAAEREPQYILRHGAVAAVVTTGRDPGAAEAPAKPKWRSMREALDEIRRVAREEDYTLDTGSRSSWSPEFDRLMRRRRAVSR